MIKKVIACECVISRNGSCQGISVNKRNNLDETMNREGNVINVDSFPGFSIE